MTDAERIATARRDYFDAGRLPADQVPHAILRSWIRCSEMGLRACATPTPDPLPAPVLRQLHERHERLRRLCRPELEMLNMEARDTSSVVLLTDGGGMVLDTLGDTGFADRAARVALRPGVPWAESSTGTNAIGTALAERRPTAVHGGEHFFADHQILSCAASPIMDPRGAVLGVLDLSGPSTGSHNHALGLVRLAADQIEHRLFRRRFEGCRMLRFHTDPGMLGTSREGILVFRDGVLVAANRRGLSLTGRGWNHLDEIDFPTLFDGIPLPGRPHTRLRTATGDHFIGVLSDGDRQDTLPDVAALELYAPHPTLPPNHPPPGHPPPDHGAPAGSLQDAEAHLIEETLARCGGNISEAARRLGIHRSTLHRRLGRRGN